MSADPFLARVPGIEPRRYRRGIYLLPSLFTVGNMFCGYACIVYAMRGEFEMAAPFVGIAFILDSLDGRIARMTNTTSAFGVELDSLADVISFGVMPASLAFAAGMTGGWDWIALIYFVCCGVSRLARYNVTAEALTGDTGKVKYFEGTPIPTSVVPLALLMIAFHHRNLLPVNIFGVEIHLLSLVFFLSGCLMISKSLRIPKL